MNTMTVPDTRNAALHGRLDAALDAALAEERIVGAVVHVRQDGRPVYARAAGLADREAGRAMRDDAIFLLASVTKPVVIAAALALAAQGVLDLDAPVTEWLPDFRPALPGGARPPIALRHLLAHTAGLDYGFMDGGAYRRLGVSDGMDAPGLGLDENLRRIAAAPLAYAPGAGWGYSVATDVLGAVLQAATGRTLPALVNELVTGPLGMTDTGFSVADRARLVAHYIDGGARPRRMAAEDAVDFAGHPIRFAPGRIHDPASFPSGGAGMAGTARDIAVFLQHLLDHGPAAMMAPHVDAGAQTQGPGWGFGWGGAVLVDPAAANSPMPAGTMQWGGVYGHNWFVDPVNRVVVVALTNTTLEGMVGRLPADLRDAVYGVAPPRT